MGKHFQKNSQTKEVKEYEEEVLQIDRVTRVVKGGRRLRFRATVVIGNRNGKVGVGVGKSEEVVGAIQKAIAYAKKNLIMVKRDGTTIPHEVKVKYKSAHLLILPAAPGTGIIAGGTVRKVVELSGVKDILSKSMGTKNKISTSRATVMALKQLKDTKYSTRVKKPEMPVTSDQAKKETTKDSKETHKPNVPHPAHKSPATQQQPKKEPAKKTPKPAEQPTKPTEKTN